MPSIDNQYNCAVTVILLENSLGLSIVNEYKVIDFRGRYVGKESAIKG